MKRQERGGFTLLELLTVIAIISVLASIVVVAAPRVLEKAKVTRQEANFRSLQTALSTYMADNNSFPPAYGYPRFEAVDFDGDGNTGNSNADNFYIRFYMDYLPFGRDPNLNDEFANDFDMNQNGQIDFFEHVPPLVEDIPNLNAYTLFTTSNQIPFGQRPVAYVTVNSKDAEIFAKYCERTNRPLADAWDPSDGGLQRIRFRTTQYDRFALVAVGPGGNEGGILTPPESVLNNYIANTGQNIYYALALRAYYLATRDLNNNNITDFDFVSRTQQNEGTAFPVLPDGSRGLGPMLYTGS